MLLIPREICCDLNQALTREWLVTNGLGGFASSTIAGANTRRYHGLLVAALKPPGGRTMTLAKIDEELETGGAMYRLGTNEYENDAIYPTGYVFLDRVEIDGMIPTFFFRAATFSLRKTIWMAHGQNTTYIRYTLEAAREPVRLTLLPLCTLRDFHTHARGWYDWQFSVQMREGDIFIRAKPEAVPYHLLTLPAANFVPMDLWYWRFRHRLEQERGLDSIEDLYLPGQWQVDLEAGQTFTVVVTTEDPATVERDIEAAFQREHARKAALARNARDDFERHLLAAADQFIVQCPAAQEPQSAIIAGYPWFAEWGRDTLIALEGLTLTTRRFAEARNILVRYSHLVDQGMLPRCFQEVQTETSSLEYDSMDTTLWYFHALDRYACATQDDTLLRDLFPVLESIMDWHIQGTRHNIHVDPADGLLYSDRTDIPLTWMDAMVEGWAVTPRLGKPVEVNALWYRALRLMEQWAARLGQSPARYGELAAQVQASFERFWYAEGGYLYDVIDAPFGDDISLRPNQLLALSLDQNLIAFDRAQSVLEVVKRHLVTPYGLRSLSPSDPRYQRLDRANMFAGESARHQGIVWAWLIGPYVDACLQVYGPGTASAALDGFQTHLCEAGLGSISEIFETEPHFRPAGCIAQAWSVAEILRIKASGS